MFGDLGEGTGGVTDPLRQRMAQFFSGDWASFEHVLMHEMVHVFQFDIFSRGRAGAGLQNLAMVNPPLWFMEGLAEYFSIGPEHPWTDAWVRDAVTNNALPTIAQMTERPDKYFPYRYGLSVWQYVGARWGDEVIGEIMNAVPSVGIDRAFRREIGMSLDELSAEWKQAMQNKYLPIVAELQRPRSFAEPLLSQKRSGSIASLFVAPALSDDGKLITYIAYGSFLRGEVFPEMYLANAETGKRITRLVKTTLNPDFEQLRYVYSQPSFSPDAKMLAFTGRAVRDGCEESQDPAEVRFRARSGVEPKLLARRASHRVQRHAAWLQRSLHRIARHRRVHAGHEGSLRRSPAAVVARRAHDRVHQ